MCEVSTLQISYNQTPTTWQKMLWFFISIKVSFSGVLKPWTSWIQCIWDISILFHWTDFWVCSTRNLCSSAMQGVPRNISYYNLYVSWPTYCEIIGKLYNAPEINSYRKAVQKNFSLFLVCTITRSYDSYLHPLRRYTS